MRRYEPWHHKIWYPMEPFDRLNAPKNQAFIGYYTKETFLKAKEYFTSTDGDELWKTYLDFYQINDLTKANLRKFNGDC